MPCGITVKPTVNPAKTSCRSFDKLYWGSHARIGILRRRSCFKSNLEVTFLPEISQVSQFIRYDCQMNENSSISPSNHCNHDQQRFSINETLALLYWISRFKQIHSLRKFTKNSGINNRTLTNTMLCWAITDIYIYILANKLIMHWWTLIYPWK